MTINTSKRRALYLGVAAVAGLTGAGLAWRHQASEDQTHAELNVLWDAEFQRPGGQRLKLSDYQGSGLVVNFWATWCPPCVEEMPLLDAFYRENSSKGWQVLGLAIDQPSQVRRFLDQFPVSYPIGLAGLGGSELGRSLGNSEGALPFTVVVDAQGRVKQRKLGRLSESDVKSWV
jgi:thiol-disulfide isomerase/thioredoxin